MSPVAQDLPQIKFKCLKCTAVSSGIPASSFTCLYYPAIPNSKTPSLKLCFTSKVTLANITLEKDHS